MIKAILALVGLNFIIEHPYIAFAIACIVGYGGYCYFQQKQGTTQEATNTPVLDADSSPDVTDLVDSLLTENRKFADFSPDQREAMFNFLMTMMQKIVDKTITEREYNAFQAIRPKLLAKIYEFQYNADVNQMTPMERKRIFNAIDNLLADKEINGLSGDKEIRLSLLIMQKLNYQARTLSQTDRDRFFVLLPKKMNNQLTAAESAEFDKLNDIVTHTPV